MEARKVFWKKSYLIKKSPQWTISGYSRSAFRTGFFLNGPNIMLDAGPQSFKKPEHIFITHSHADHIANLPFTLIGDENGDHVFNIYVPKQAETKIKKYICSMFEANALADNLPVDKWYSFKGIEKNTEPFNILANKNKIRVEVISCDHSIPTVSYGLGLIKNKLNPIYKGMSGRELGELRKSGKTITVEVIEKVLAFVCDTSIAVFKRNPCILEYSTVFIECTFISPGEEDVATSKKHIHWNQLKPYVINHPNITFVLFHFSLKYKDEGIKEIMDKEFETHNIKNIELWLPDLV